MYPWDQLGDHGDPSDQATRRDGLTHPARTAQDGSPTRRARATRATRVTRHARATPATSPLPATPAAQALQEALDRRDNGGAAPAAADQ
jgi:hypothetical protein